MASLDRRRLEPIDIVMPCRHQANVPEGCSRRRSLGGSRYRSSGDHCQRLRGGGEPALGGGQGTGGGRCGLLRLAIFVLAVGECALRLPVGRRLGRGIVLRLVQARAGRGQRLLRLLDGGLLGGHRVRLRFIGFHGGLPFRGRQRLGGLRIRKPLLGGGHLRGLRIGGGLVLHILDGDRLRRFQRRRSLRDSGLRIGRRRRVGGRSGGRLERLHRHRLLRLGLLQRLRRRLLGGDRGGQCRGGELAGLLGLRREGLVGFEARLRIGCGLVRRRLASLRPGNFLLSPGGRLRGNVSAPLVLELPGPLAGALFGQFPLAPLLIALLGGQLDLLQALRLALPIPLRLLGGDLPLLRLSLLVRERRLGVAGRVREPIHCRLVATTREFGGVLRVFRRVALPGDIALGIGSGALGLEFHLQSRALLFGSGLRLCGGLVGLGLGHGELGGDGGFGGLCSQDGLVALGLGNRFLRSGFFLGQTLHIPPGGLGLVVGILCGRNRCLLGGAPLRRNLGGAFRRLFRSRQFGGGLVDTRFRRLHFARRLVDECLTFGGQLVHGGLFGGLGRGLGFPGDFQRLLLDAPLGDLPGIGVDPREHPEGLALCSGGRLGGASGGVQLRPGRRHPVNRVPAPRLGVRPGRFRRFHIPQRRRGGCFRSRELVGARGEIGRRLVGQSLPLRRLGWMLGGGQRRLGPGHFRLAVLHAPLRGGNRLVGLARCAPGGIEIPGQPFNLPLQVFQRRFGRREFALGAFQRGGGAGGGLGRPIGIQLACSLQFIECAGEFLLKLGLAGIADSGLPFRLCRLFRLLLPDDRRRDLLRSFLQIGHLLAHTTLGLKERHGKEENAKNGQRNTGSHHCSQFIFLHGFSVSHRLLPISVHEFPF